MKKHLKLIGLAFLLVAVVVACGKKKEKEELKTAIDKANKMLEDNQIKKGHARIYKMDPDLKEKKEAIVKTLEDAQAVHDDKKGDYKAATEKVNQAIEDIEALVEEIDEAKTEGGGLREGRMSPSGDREGGLRQQGAAAANAGEEATQSSGAPVEKAAETTKRQPGSRLKNR
ncbi:MAG: hypothetical protein JW801_01635 [Bacteroidales bacterium]|nr:hypothetical protein [Bacteroidales bacterium]